jgi:glucan 1,3-beta-glucosidase
MSDPFPHAPVTRFWLATFIVNLAALVALAAWIALETRPVALPELHLEAGERLRCVSYAPYHEPGQTPLDPHTRIPREQIEADLTALAGLTECVRIYSVDQGLEQVPAIARALGLKVLLGAWIGAEPPRNRTQLDTAVRLANTYPDTVRALIVGNEVLLRREQTPAALKAYIDDAKLRVSVPVTYADVWEFWLRQPELARSVDFVTAHILPFWEDQPVAIDKALEHVAKAREIVARQLGKPVLIGETGWPSAGRQREVSRPSLVNQARYIREFVARARAEGWDYNLIEAIDQPWKRRLEGTVGGFWGMLDSALRPKFSFTTPVAERADASPAWIAIAAGGAAGLALALLGGRGHAGRRLKCLASTASGGVVGGVLLLQWEHAQLAYRDALEWSLLAAVSAVGAAIPALIAWWSGQGRIEAAARAWRRHAAQHSIAGAIALARLTVLFAAATAATLLAVDPRYRDFPLQLYAAPAVSLAVLALAARGVVSAGVEERLLGTLIALAGTARWLMEPFNPQAVAWLGVCLLLALGGLVPVAQQNQQTE